MNNKNVNSECICVIKMEEEDDFDLLTPYLNVSLVAVESPRNLLEQEDRDSILIQPTSPTVKFILHTFVVKCFFT